MDRKKVKEAIWRFEYYRNGFHLLRGDVEVKNLKLLKDKAVADIILYGERGMRLKEYYPHCEFPYKILGL